MVLCSIYDVVSGVFSHPNCFENVNVALRHFKMLKDEKGVPFKDLELYKVGEFDVTTGVIVPFTDYEGNNAMKLLVTGGQECE